MSDESLFREVDEEVRQEQLKKIWDRYGNYILALCLVLVALVAGYKGWQYWQVKQAEAAAGVYSQALDELNQGKVEDAERALESITHPGFRTLARLREAAALAKAGKPDEAVKAYDAVAADTSVASPFRDLARIRAGYLLVDKLAPSDLAARLGGLEKSTGPWRNAAREILSLSAYKNANYIEADRYANEIMADAGTPPAMRQRAHMMSELLLPLLDKKTTQ